MREPRAQHGKHGRGRRRAARPQKVAGQWRAASASAPRREWRLAPRGGGLAPRRGCGGGWRLGLKRCLKRCAATCRWCHPPSWRRHRRPWPRAWACRPPRPAASSKLGLAAGLGLGVWACGRVGVWACGRVGVWACGRGAWSSMARGRGRTGCRAAWGRMDALVQRLVQRACAPRFWLGLGLGLGIGRAHLLLAKSVAAIAGARRQLLGVLGLRRRCALRRLVGVRVRVGVGVGVEAGVRVEVGVRVGVGVGVRAGVGVGVRVRVRVRSSLTSSDDEVARSSSSRARLRVEQATWLGQGQV